VEESPVLFSLLSTELISVVSLDLGKTPLLELEELRQFPLATSASFISRIDISDEIPGLITISIENMRLII